MGYYLRVFCASDEIPPLGEALSRLAEEDVELRLDPAHMSAEPEADWRQAAVLYEDGKRPFIVEASRAAEDELVVEEVQEFIELLDLPDSPAKRACAIAAAARAPWSPLRCSPTPRTTA